MKKIIVLVLLVFSYVMGTSQAITQRGTSAVTVQDARLFAQYNFRPPVFPDTTSANAQIGLDSCGALIFSRDINSYYYRGCNPKKWILIAATSINIGDSAWLLGGNTNPSSSNLGTKDAKDINIITNNIARYRVASNGIYRSSAARNKYLTIDTLTKYLYYGDAGAMGDTSINWQLSGNSNAVVGNFLGTTNNIPLEFRIKNVKSGIIDSTNKNVGLGFNTLKLNTPNGASIGTYNVAIGHNALSKDTLGSQNVAIGGAALGTLTTKSTGNVAIGYASLNQSKTPSYDVAIGWGALARDYYGSANVAIGADVANFLPPNAGDTMRYNTMIGYASAKQKKSGKFNVFIGDSTGVINQNGSGNVFIGSRAGSQDTTSNKLYISNSGTTTPLIKGEFDNSKMYINGNLQVGTAQMPDSTLDVKGGVRILGLLSSNNTSDSMMIIKSDGGVGFRSIPSGGGSVSISQGYGITNSPNPITTTGTITADTSVSGLSGKYLRIIDTTNKWWGINGNSGTNSSVNYLGTIDNQDLILKRNGVVASTFRADGNHSIGGIGTVGGSLTGTNNIAVGFADLSTITTGSFNMQYGTGAVSITTGNDNICMGVFSGYRVSTGSNNVSIGRSTGFNRFLNGDRQGNYNTCIGAFSGSTYGDLSTGHNNTFIGSNSGNNFISSSSYNIVLGDSSELEASVSPASNTSIGNRNIIIGSNINSPNRFGSNQLTIGNLIFGTDLDGKIRTISSGKIGIGVSAPTDKLHVAGTAKVTDTLKLTGLQSKTDTSANKPLAIDASGNVVKMSNWVSGGGSSTVYVDSIYRTAGKDSIYYKKNGNTYAIKDSVGTNPPASGYYLSISDSTTQDNPTANTPRAVKFNVTDLANGFSLNTQTAIFVGTINNGGVGAGTTLNVTSLTSGKIKVGMVLTGGSITAGTFISAFISGSGGIGTYEVSVSQLRTSATYTGTMTSQIVCANTGIYNLQFSSQMDKTDAGVDYVNFWLRKNGTDITASSGVISLQGNSPAYMMAAWNYVIQLVAGDTIELYWGSADINMSIKAETSQTSPFAHPAVQSTIFTITQQAGILAGTGITAINSLTGSAQTMVTGTDSTDFKIVSTGTSHTFNLPTASASKRGALSSTDWTTFNNKIGASDTSVFLRKSDSSTYYTKYRSDTSRTNIYSAINNKLNTSNFESQLVLGYQGLGSTIKGTLLGVPNPQLATATGGLTSGRITYEAVYLSTAQTITGVKFYQATAGVYTGNNYNGVALYSYSGGTLTLVASSTNDATFWTGSGWVTKPFATPYSAAAGVYFVAQVYSRSAEVTQPGLAQLTLNATFSVMDFTNGAKLVGYSGSITALPSTATISPTSTGTSCIGLYLY
jgi:hypothetical protein